MKAPFIALEGIGGTGKSTATEYIGEIFRKHGFDPVLTREPGGTRCAEHLRRLVREGFPGADLNEPLDVMDPMGVTLLFNAARVDHVNKVIKPAMEAGRPVITDRFCDSTFAYQSVYNNIPMGKLLVLHDLAVGIYPDMTFIFTCPVSIAASRISSAEKGSDQFDRAGLDQQEAMQQVYVDRYTAYPERYTLIDASVSEAEVREQLFPHVMKIIYALQKPVKGQCKGGCPYCKKPVHSTINQHGYTVYGKLHQ